MTNTGDLPDINVWLAFLRESHPHHLRAVAYFAEDSLASCAFCRVTMLGLIRLLTNSAVMEGKALTCIEAMALQQAVQTAPSVIFLDEPADILSPLRAFSSLPGCSSGLWTDAYLAAFAVSGGLRIVSFDSDFSRFPGLSFLHLAV